MEDAIRVSNLKLTYKATTRRQTIRSMRFFSGKESVKRITALEDVSFTVKKGEILGILGTNGSGKSTLLRTLAGVLSPDSGSVETFGKSVSLLALGVGFNPDLSGMDNIYLSGMLQGYTEKEISRKCQEIVDFSELGSAIMRPVKTYSSGMHSKLAFSIAVTLKTDIILVDEVLSVGDIRFRQKSHKKMEELIKDRDSTVIIVSHNMNEIKQLCDRVLWLEKGHVRGIGPTDQMIKDYLYELENDPNYISSLPTPEVTVAAEEKGIRVKWNSIELASDYRVYRKNKEKGAKWESIQDGYYGTEYLDTLAAPGKQYFYTVRARAKTENGAVWSEFKSSEAVSFEGPTA